MCETTEQAIEGGEPIAAATLQACLDDCMGDTLCLAVDWNTEFNECFKHTAETINNPKNTDGVAKHYRKLTNITSPTQCQ